ncbi:MAG: cytochrome P450 [Pyrinomonadaceae bacterium]
MGYDLNSPAFLNDPYPVYDKLRANDPVYWSEANNYWIVTRYADIATLIHDPRASSNRFVGHTTRLPARAKEQFRPFINAVSSWMLMVDPPDHTRLRGLVNKAFTPGMVGTMRARIHEIVDQILKKATAQGSFDIIADLAVPLPGIVIAEMLGVPASDLRQFKQWSDDIAAGLIGIDTAGGRDEVFRMYTTAQDSLLALSNYFREKVAALRRQPQDNLLGALAQAEEAGDRLSEEELFANCVLLMIAGHETTTNLIGNGMLALLRNPKQQKALRDSPDLIVSAVEELLRYDSPVQKMARMAVSEIPVGNKQIETGQLVFLCFAAANRDPGQFAMPNELDIKRKENRHLAFGKGLHYCLGAALARLEGQIAINNILQSMPRLRIIQQELKWHPSITLRGLQSLPVAFS